MRRALLCAAWLAAATEVPYACPSLPPAGVNAADRNKPNVVGAFTFMNGVVAPYHGDVDQVQSPIWDLDTGERAFIGNLARMDERYALGALDAAVSAWDGGQGAWPRMSLGDRIRAVEAVMASLQERRAGIIDVLMWEIAKTGADAAKEFDRTAEFVREIIKALKADPSLSGLSEWTSIKSVSVRMRRGPIGVLVALAPFNYPLNEMYAMLIPALLVGNVAVLKLPATGGLVHTLTAKAFAKHLPPGVLNFVTGSGRETVGPIMKTGKVDALGFIGGTRGADALIKAHPSPHRLKVFSQLEAKNLGIVLPDADVDVAAAQCVLGATSYNGQRCTAIKLVMVHESIADELVARMRERIAKLKAGLPWEDGVSITPLAEPNKPKILEGLIGDALQLGATLANAAEGGGELRGALMTPALVDGVTPAMRLFHEEQFGPVVPIARYRDIAEVTDALKASWSGQQAAVFTTDASAASPVIDALSTIVGRININSQCARSPDTVPFSARRSSAMGTMSVTESIRAFSVETVVAHGADDAVSKRVAEGVDGRAKVFAPVE